MSNKYQKETKNAIQNFPISGYLLPKEFIRNLVLLKQAAVEAAYEIGGLSNVKKRLIVKATKTLLQDNSIMSQFPLDVFQTGSGTSTNMNANEVIATMASTNTVIIHPNNDVNWGQSSNCVIPSVINITNATLIPNLIKSLVNLELELAKISKEHTYTYKIGRTHLQDAVPMSIGQEFGAFASQIDSNINNLKYISKQLQFIPIGGTAIGTMVASSPRFSKLVCKYISEKTKIKFMPSKNKFKDIATRDTQVALMSQLSTLCVSLMKISNDLRLLSSGPKTGLGEISFKKIQAGSSIMPGKVNPVICESMIQVCAYVIGNNNAINIAGQNSPLQLNMMMPLIAYLSTESIRILTNAINNFTKNGIKKIIINKQKALSWVEKSFSLITPLVRHPKIGYDLATEIVQKANMEEVTIREYLINHKILPIQEIEKILNIKNMIIIKDSHEKKHNK